MSSFIPCTHPDLPGVVVDLARPFGQWRPVQPALEGSDPPPEGEPTHTPAPTQDQE